MQEEFLSFFDYNEKILIKKKKHSETQPNYLQIWLWSLFFGYLSIYRISSWNKLSFCACFSLSVVSKLRIYRQLTRKSWNNEFWHRFLCCGMHDSKLDNFCHPTGKFCHESFKSVQQWSATNSFIFFHLANGQVHSENALRVRCLYIQCFQPVIS